MCVCVGGWVGGFFCAVSLKRADHPSKVSYSMPDKGYRKAGN
jgi:hypothetical protein